MLSETWQLVLFNILMLAVSVIAISIICDGKSNNKDEKWVRNFFLTGFCIFHGIRWLPFLFLLLV